MWGKSTKAAMRALSGPAVAVWVLLSLLMSPAPAGAAETSPARQLSVVSAPATISSGETATFTVQLSGVTAAELDAGIEWSASDVRTLVGQWRLQTNLGRSEVSLTRYLGATAVFEWNTNIPGRHQVQISATVDGPSAIQPNPIVVEVTAAAPGMRILPPPPTNVRIETQGLANPVPGPVAFYQARVVADSNLLTYYTYPNGVTEPASLSIEITGPFTLTQDVRSDATATPWRDVSSRWIDVPSANPSISLEYWLASGDTGYFTYSRDDLAIPLSFSAASVLEVYPPRAALRCAGSGARLYCQATAINEGSDRESVTVLSPPTLSIAVQRRVWQPKSRTWSKWSKPVVVDSPINGAPADLSFPLSASQRRSPHEVRATVTAYPSASVTARINPQAPPSQAQWAVS